MVDKYVKKIKFFLCTANFKQENYWFDAQLPLKFSQGTLEG